MGWASVVSAVENVLDSGHLRLAAGISEELYCHLGWIRQRVDSLPASANSGVRQRVKRIVIKAAEQTEQLQATTVTDIETDQRLNALVAVQRGCIIIYTCAQLARKCSLGDRASVYQLAAAIFKLMFSTGTQLFSSLADGTIIATPHVRVVYLDTQLTQSVVTSVLLRQQADSCAEGRSASSAIAAVYRTVAEPSAMLPWLAAAGRLLLRAQSDFAGAELSQQQSFPGEVVDVGLQYTRIVAEVISGMCPELQAHQEALAADVGLQAEVLSPLLCLAEHAIQLLGGGNSASTGSSSSSSAGASEESPSAPTWRLLCNGLQCAATDIFGPVLQQGPDGPQMRLRMLDVAARALQLVSTDEGPWELHRSGVSSFSADMVAMVSAVVEDLRDDQVLKETATKLLQLMPALAVGATRLLGPASREEQGNSACQLHAYGMCVSLTGTLQLLLTVDSGSIVTDFERAAWVCEAANAGLRLLPLLAALGQQWRHRPPAPDMSRQKAAAVAVELPEDIHRFWRQYLVAVGLLHQEHHASIEGMQRIASALAVPLWQLHTTVCRLIHWASAPQSAQLAARIGVWEFNDLSMTTHFTFTTAFEANRMAEKISALAGEDVQALMHRQLHGMAAAHAEVLLVLAKKFGHRLDDPGSPFRRGVGYIMHAATHFPSQLDPQILDAFFTSTRRHWRAAPDASTQAERVQEWVHDAVDWPHFAALLLTSGLLAEGLQLLEQSCAAGGIAVPPSFCSLMRYVFALANNLCNRGSREVEDFEDALYGSGDEDSEDEPSDRHYELKNEITVAEQELRAALRSSDAINPSATLAACRRCQQELVPAAVKLAHALVAYWEDTSAGQLAAAQAAATRSCAYLCCANLAGQGGPGAGEGKGSRRCSGCRAAWYCGTACSHADWKQGGHKAACKALAAAHRRERKHGLPGAEFSFPM